MDRKDFLKKAGLVMLAGPFLLRGWGPKAVARAVRETGANCVLLPFQTGGPFYLDPEFNRTNLRENLSGLPLSLKIRVIGVQNCAPIPNAVVNIWHTDTHGGYSQFGAVAGNYDDFSNETWLRGYQMTDAQGECTFTTLFPGWYPGRAAHIHFDVHIGFVSGGTIDTTRDASSFFLGQMYFPDAITSQVYTQVAPYSTWGDSSTNQTNDGILNQTGQAGDLTVAIDSTDFPNSLSGEFCIGLNTSGTPTGIAEPASERFFTFAPLYPNPMQTSTHIDFTLRTRGQVTLSVFDAEGKMVSQLTRRNLAAGTYSVEYFREKAGLAAGKYLVDLLLHHREGMSRKSQELIVL